MSEYTKQFYSIGEVSQMLELPVNTLRFWESEFPMFKPHRTPGGTRRFSPADIDMAKFIKELLYDKGMKIDGAIALMNKTYRVQPPRRPRKCENPAQALALLDEIKLVLTSPHDILKVESLRNWINAQPTQPTTHANS